MSYNSPRRGSLVPRLIIALLLAAGITASWPRRDNPTPPAAAQVPPAVTTASTAPAPAPTREPAPRSPVDQSAFFAQLAKRARSPEPIPTLQLPRIEAPIVQQRLVVLETDLRTFLQRPDQERAAARFRVPTPDGREQEIEIQRVDSIDPDQGAIQGVIPGVPGSHVTLGYAQEAVAGSWFIPGEGLFQIRYAGNGQHRVLELDPTRFPPDGQPSAEFEFPPPPPAPVAPTMALGNASTAPSAEDPEAFPKSEGDLPNEGPIQVAPLPQADAPPAIAASDAATVIDVLVVYTTACKNANGGASGMTALINAATATANTAYNNSGAAQSLRIVYSTEITYSETGALGTDLGRLRSTSDGILDSVHTLRDSYKADLVSLFVTGASDSAGIAYLWMPGYAASVVAQNGFSVVVDIYADANLTFAHELGHNMGCGHAPGDGGSGAFSYSTGLRFSAGGSAYRTVMAYAPGVRIPYFSNPSVSYLGVATGSSTANNTRTLADSRASVSAFRDSGALSSAWTVVATGDLNADSKPDILWRNTSTGRVLVWYMNGTTSTGNDVLWAASAVGDSLWVPIATADFNADSKPDIIWRNSSTGRVIVWIMNGITRTSTVTIWAASAVGDSLWVPIATGDFNADNKPDIIWRNSSTGRVIIWMMDGTTRTSTSTIWSPASAGDTLWVPIATGDFTADSKPDIVWRNSSSGRVIIWTMNGVTRTATTTIWPATGPTDYLWVPRASGDFDASGAPDLIWRNSSSGRTIAWLLSGTTTSSTAIVWTP